MKAFSPVDNYLPVCVIMLKILGILELEGGLFYRMISILIYAFNIFTSCHLTILKIRHVLFYSNTSEIGDLIYSIHHLIMYMVVSVLLIWMRLRRGKIIQILDHINNNFVFYSARGLTNATMMKPFLLCKKLMTVMVLWAVIANQQPALMPLFKKAKYGGFPLPVEITYPYDISKYYAASYFFQYCQQIMIPLIYCGFLCFFAGSCYMMSGQLDLLYCSLVNVRFTAMLRCGITHEQLIQHFSNERNELYDKMNYFCTDVSMKDSQYHFDKPSANARFDENPRDITQLDIYSKKYDKTTEVSLKECILLHEKITEFYVMFSKLMTSMLLFKIFHIPVHQSTLLYGFSLTLNPEILQFYLLTVADLSAYCYSGHHVMTQSLRLTDAVYESPWWSCGKGTTRLMLVYMTTLMKPYILSGANFFSMTLYSFVTILKMAYTFFTFTRNMREV